MRALFGACLMTLSLPACAHGADAAQRAYLSGHYVDSARLYLAQAERGRALAQTHLGYQFQYGLGVPQSYEEAARWYFCAAEQGEPNAQFYLGQLYDRGQGVFEDPVEAGKWLDLAAAHASASRGEYWRTMRDEIDGKMTLDELAEARRRALVWRPSYACAPVLESETLQLPTHKDRRGEADSER